MTLMTDMNETIVRRFYETAGWFVRSNVPYKPTSNSTDSDVDLVMIHPDGRTAAVEVKGWHTEAITMSTVREQPSLFGFVTKEAQKAIDAIIGGLPQQNLLVVSRLGRDRAQVKEEAQSRGVEVLEFKDVLKGLISTTVRNKNAGSDAEHMLRLLHVYGFLQQSE